MMKSSVAVNLTMPALADVIEKGRPERGEDGQHRILLRVPPYPLPGLESSNVDLVIEAVVDECITDRG
ncbi:hypothetical protein Tco_1104589 [Tanacetum coccineum]